MVWKWKWYITSKVNIGGAIFYLKKKKNTEKMNLLMSLLELFSQDYNLASHTTYMVGINFIHEWQDLQINRQTFEKFFNFVLLLEVVAWIFLFLFIRTTDYHLISQHTTN